MAKIKVAIYDDDKVYRERFTDYLMSYKSQEMELSIFTKPEYFLEKIIVDKYQLLVLGCGYEELLARVRLLQIPVLVLSEYSKDYVRESVGIEDIQVSYTSKYQSMDVITHQMYLMTEARRIHGDCAWRMGEQEIIGVFSPVNHEMQMFFSLLYAKNAARHDRVLYLNLLEFSGFSELFGEREADMSDVILQFRENKLSPECLFQFIYELEEISYISPFKNPENLKEISGQDIEALLRFINQYTDYRTIVIDFGMAVNDFVQNVAVCTKLYCLSKTGYFFESRMRQFFNYLEKTAKKEVLERIETLVIPYQAKTVCGGGNLLEQLNWSEFGDFVRKV